MPRISGKRKRVVDEHEGSSVESKKITLSEGEVTGNVFTLGQGDVGQLGLGSDVTERKRPALVKEIEAVQCVQVTCGGMHSVAVSSSGEVYTWGCNDDGALGRDTSANDEEEYIPRKVVFPDSSIHISLVSAGDSHTAALTSDGRVFAWGAYRDASGHVGLTASLLAGKNQMTQIYPPADARTHDPAIKIASGNDHTVILTRDGNVYSGGTGEQGQLGRVKECFGSRGGRRGLDFVLRPQLVRLRNKKVKFLDVFCGSFSTYAVCKNTSDVYAWGLNNYGQLCSGDVVNRFNPEKMQLLSDIRAKAPGRFVVGAGQHHVVIVDGEGHVYSAGRADYGRLGLGKEAEETRLPTLITSFGNTKVTAVACGECVSFAITDGGHVYSWGLGTSMQLGVGEDEDIFVPTLLKSKLVDPEVDEVLGVSSGGQHTLILARKRKGAAVKTAS